jgi:PleD family two-component response regulator
VACLGQPVATKKKLLVMDDDDAVRESSQKVLQEAGYEVELAVGGLKRPGDRTWSSLICCCWT